MSVLKPSSRLARYKDQLDSAKEQFRKRMDQFAKANKLLSQNASISNDELAELKRNHKEEVDGLVKKANRE